MKKIIFLLLLAATSCFAAAPPFSPAPPVTTSQVKKQKEGIQLPNGDIVLTDTVRKRIPVMKDTVIVKYDTIRVKKN